MNIFLDKSLPKRTRILLQIVRVILLIVIFGSIFYASVNPAADDVLLYISIGLATFFIGFKIIVERRKQNPGNKRSAE